MITSISNVDHHTAVDAISQLETRLFGKGAWTPGMVEQELGAPARTYILDTATAQAAGPDDINGYAGYWYDGDDAELMTIGVRPERQRQGIARRMLEHLLAQAQTQGARRMLLEVRVDNTPAIALYESLGFTRLGLRKRYYQPEGVDAYTMSKDLAPRIAGFSAN